MFNPSISRAVPPQQPASSTITSYQCSTSSSFVIFDNRLCPHYDFQTEACSNAYHRLTMDLMSKLLHITSVHPSISPPHGIAIAASPNTVKLFKSTDILNPITLFEPRFSLLGGNASANQTWMQFLSDAIIQIGKTFSSSFPNTNPATATNNKPSVVEPYPPYNQPYQPYQPTQAASTRLGLSTSMLLPQVPSVATVQALLSPQHQVFVTIFSTDMNLLGDRQYTAGSIQDGLQSFFQYCQALKALIPGLRVKIVCVRVSTSPLYESSMGIGGGSRFHDHNSFLLHSELASASAMDSSRSTNKGYRQQQKATTQSTSSSNRDEEGWIVIHHIHPTVMIYEDELKTLLGMMIPRICTMLELPSIAGLQCEMKVELKAHSMRCLDCIHYMRSLETCSVTTRSGIDPKFIVGYGFEVTSPDETIFASVSGLETAQSCASNRFMLETFKTCLATKNLVLIVRVPYTIDDYPEQCSKYWALIPPIASANAASNGTSADSVQCDGPMTLIMLADRDECVIPYGPIKSSSSSTASMPSMDENTIKAMKTQTISFFEAAIQTGCGGPSTYNPWAFVGGQLNAQFSKSRLITGSAGPSAMRATTATASATASRGGGTTTTNRTSTSTRQTSTKATTNETTSPHVIDLATETPTSTVVSTSVSSGRGGRGRGGRGSTARGGGGRAGREGRGGGGRGNTTTNRTVTPSTPPEAEPEEVEVIRLDLVTTGTQRASTATSIPTAHPTSSDTFPLLDPVNKTSSLSTNVTSSKAQRPKLLKRKFHFEWGTRNEGEWVEEDDEIVSDRYD